MKNKEEHSVYAIKFYTMQEQIDNLQKKAELADHYKHLYSEVKKQKNDVVELIKTRIKENEGHINARIEIYHYKNMLRMLGEIDVKD